MLIRETEAVHSQSLASHPRYFPVIESTCTPISDHAAAYCVGLIQIDSLHGILRHNSRGLLPYTTLATTSILILFTLDPLTIPPRKNHGHCPKDLQGHPPTVYCGAPPGGGTADFARHWQWQAPSCSLSGQR